MLHFWKYIKETLIQLSNSKHFGRGLERYNLSEGRLQNIHKQDWNNINTRESFQIWRPIHPCDTNVTPRKTPGWIHIQLDATLKLVSSHTEQ